MSQPSMPKDPSHHPAPDDLHERRERESVRKPPHATTKPPERPEASSAPTRHPGGRPSAPASPAQTQSPFAMAEILMRPWLEAHQQVFRLWSQMLPPMAFPLSGMGPGTTAKLPWDALPNPLHLAALPLQQRPRGDLAECRNCYELTVDLPGLSQEDIEVRCGPGVVMVIGERREEREGERLGLALAERRFGRFERTFSLPPDADACRSEASYNDGVLRIRAPKLKTGRDGLVEVPVER